jgi:hypothetical protein
MSNVQIQPLLCPLCQSALEMREVTPCMDCGGHPREREHTAQGLHSYERLRAFGRFEIVLCDFCRIDFGSYPNYFFGLPSHQHTGYNSLESLGPYQGPKVVQDHFCNQCGYSLRFLQFVADARSYHKAAFPEQTHGDDAPPGGS